MCAMEKFWPILYGVVRFAMFAALFAAAACSLFASAFRVPSLSCGELPNTEVVTNVPIRVNSDTFKSFTLSLDVANCLSNEVVVAVGRDSNGDGDLSFDETALAYGLDCGNRYLCDYRTGSVQTNMPDSVSIGKGDFDTSWNLVKVVKRGGGEVGEQIELAVESASLRIYIR